MPTSIADTNKSSVSLLQDSDVSRFVHYLLEGSGSEKAVDYSQIRRALDNAQSTPAIKSPLSYNATIGSDIGGTGTTVDPITSDIESPTSESLGSDLVASSRYKDRSNYASARQSVADPPARRLSMLPSKLPVSISESTTTSNLMSEARQAIEEEVASRMSRRPHETSVAELNVQNLISENLPSTPPSSDFRVSEFNTSLKQQQQDKEYDTEEYGTKDKAYRFSSAGRSNIGSSVSAMKPSNSSHSDTQDVFGTSYHPLKFQSATIPSSGASQVPQPNSLASVSKSLSDIGLSPIHPCLLYAPTIRYPSSSPLSEKQQDAIRAIIDSLLTEAERKEKIVQNLLTRLNDVQERSQKWEDRAWLTEQQRMEEMGADTDIIDSLKGEIKEKNSKATKFAVELASARSELEQLKNDAMLWQRRLAKSEDEKDNLKFEIAAMKEQVERTRQRNERTFAAITSQYRRDPSKSGLDRLTLEVIDVYERKLLALHDENAKLKVRASTSPSRRFSEDPEQNLVNINDEVTRLKHRTVVFNSKVAEDEAFIRLESAMSQQISELKAQLADSRDALMDSKRETDLLRLKMLSMKDLSKMSQKDSAIHSPSTKSITRALIRRHKKAWKLKLYRIDAMAVEDCRDLLKDICVKLNIDDVDRLLSAINTIDKVMKLVPQMQKFIEDVDVMVWRIYGQANGHGKHPHKLTDTLAYLDRWSEAVGDIDILRDFRERVLTHLRIDESPQSTSQTLELLRRLSINPKSRDQHKNVTSTEQLIKHFKDLFEVDSQQDVFTRINELYVFTAEVKKGLRNLAEALRAPATLSPGSLIAKAVEAVHSLIELSQAVRSNACSPTNASMIRHSNIDYPIMDDQNKHPEEKFKLHSNTSDSEDHAIDNHRKYEQDEQEHEEVDIGNNRIYNQEYDEKGQEIEDEICQDAGDAWKPLSSTLSGLERLLGRRVT